jgi:hypothetical protein
LVWKNLFEDLLLDIPQPFQGRSIPFASPRPTYKQGQTPTFFSSQSLQVAATADKQLVPFSFEAKAIVPLEKEAKLLASLPPDLSPL